MTWTPRELIDSLSKWNQDEPIELRIANNPKYAPQQITPGATIAREVLSPTEPPFVGILSQGLNSINLSDRD